MAVDVGESGFNEASALKILEADWRQSSVFEPSNAFPLPAGFVGPGELLVVCTHSCSLVSPSLSKDPLVEVLVGKPVELDKHKSAGRNYRLFHLKVDGPAGEMAIECDINRRAYMPREILVGPEPAKHIIRQDNASRDFAIWLGRYYLRVSLPSELVRRLDARGGISDTIAKILKSKKDSPLGAHLGVEGLYVKWLPDREIEDPEIRYDLFFRVLCTDRKVQEELERKFDTELERFTSAVTSCGINLTMAVQLTSQVFVSELEHYHRFSEEDYLSSPGQVAQSYDRQAVG